MDNTKNALLLPAIVICGGSYHVPAHYETLIKALEDKGYEVRCPALPTMHVVDMTAAELEAASPDDEPEPPAEGYVSGDADIEVVRHEIKALVARGKRVLLVGHSYGGWVATESAAPELRCRDGSMAAGGGGGGGGVVGIFYFTALLLPVNESMESFFAPPDGEEVPLPPWVKVGKYGKQGLIRPYNTEKFFYNDVPVDEAKKYVAMLKGQSLIHTRSQHLSYVDLPCAYLKCTNDQVFPVNVQDMYMGFATEKGGKMTVFTCEAGHIPFLTKMDEVVDAVIQFTTSL